MSRSLKKGAFVDPKLMKKINALRPGDQTIIKTWARDSVIVPEMVGFTLAVHNGKTHILVRITESMIEHRLGEFSATRKFVRHGGKIQKAIDQSKNKK